MVLMMASIHGSEGAGTGGDHELDMWLWGGKGRRLSRVVSGGRWGE